MIALRTVAPVCLPMGAALITELLSVRSVRLAQLVNSGIAAAQTSALATMRRITTPSRSIGHDCWFCKASHDESMAGIGRKRERLNSLVGLCAIDENDHLARELRFRAALSRRHPRQ